MSLNQNELTDLDEPISVTIKRDLLSFLTKVRYVLFPFSLEDKIKEIRNWDLFGPLIIGVALSVLMILKSKSDKDHLFAAIFFILIVGSLIVTLNAKLVGVKFSVFFYVSALGYSLAPFLIAATVNLFLGSLITKMGVLIVTAFCYLWSLKSVSVFFQLSIKPTRKNLVFYPIIIYYLFFAWFVILE